MTTELIRTSEHLSGQHTLIQALQVHMGTVQVSLRILSTKVIYYVHEYNVNSSSHPTSLRQEVRQN